MAVALFRLPPGDQWDQALLSRLLSDRLYHHGVPIEEHHDWPVSDGLILVIPGRYWHHRTAELTDILTRYRWVLAIRTGDEEDLFDPASIVHPNIMWWVQTPKAGHDYPRSRFFGVGYSPGFVDLRQPEAPTMERDVFLSAQDNHARRHEFFARLEDADLDARVQATRGFTQGMDPWDYAHAMMASRAAPAPSGPHTPDTFRACEALEVHTVPVVDDISTHNPHPGYWRRLYPDAPFPVVTDLDDLVGYTRDVVAAHPRLHNRVAAWWMRRKADFSWWLRDDLEWLGNPVPDPQPVTIVVPTSPIPSHPSIAILDETLGSIRHHFPTATIILTFDGVRPEQDHRRDDYEEYIRRALWRADHHWRNVIPVLFEEHHHQAEMMRRVLDEIDTPLVLYVEHDAPLVTDWPIDWEQITNLVMSGDYHSVRLYHEASVPAAHDHLMHGRDGDILRTSQWSQRPHLASKAFYRRVIGDHFAVGERSFIEDRMHSVVDVAVREDGMTGWGQWRLGIYAPDDGRNNFKRSYHTDGRAGEDNDYP